MSHIQALIDAVKAYKSAKEHFADIEEDHRLERVSEGELKRMKTMRDDCWENVINALKRA